MTPDLHTIERLQQRDHLVIGELYDQYSATLFGIILRIVRSEVLAEDVLQDTFVKIWKYGPDYDPAKGTLFTWMLNIARRKAIDKTRSAAFRYQASTLSAEDYVSQLSYQPSVDTIGLRRIVDGLDEKYRTIIELVYFDGFTQSEVMDHLGIPLGTVKSRLRIGMRELRKFFGEHSVSILVICLQLVTFLTASY